MTLALDDATISEIARRVADLIRPATPPGLLTKDEIAQAFRVTTQCIDIWARSGMPFKDMGHYKLFERQACETWAAGRRKRGRPPVAKTEAPSLEGVEFRSRKTGT